MRAITAVFIAALVVLLCGFVVIYAGVYDVAATAPSYCGMLVTVGVRRLAAVG